MEQFFEPKSIVIFGASANRNKGGNQVTRNMKRYMKANKDVDLSIVHPKRERIEGIRCFSSLTDLMDEKQLRIDLALLVLPISAVIPTIKDCIKHEVRGVVVESGNLVDCDDPQMEEQMLSELSELLKNSETKLVGPNALGFYNPGKKLSTALGLTMRFLGQREKNVSFCGQSGLFVTGFIYQFQKNQPFGLAKACAIGNKFDVNECDVLEYYLEDPETDVIAMYLEDIRDGKRFLTVLKKNTEHKPIIILKAGKTEKAKEAIMSHTGSIAGNYKIFQGLSKQNNIILVENYRELFECASVLANVRNHNLKSNKVGVISISGSGCVLASDYCEKYGLALPEITEKILMDVRGVFPSWAPIHNPIDTWVSIEKVGDHRSYNTILSAFLESNRYDSIVMATIASQFARFDFEFIAEMKEKYPDIPIILHNFGGYNTREFIKEACVHGIPLLENFETIFMLLGKIWKNS